MKISLGYGNDRAYYTTRIVELNNIAHLLIGGLDGTKRIYNDKNLYFEGNVEINSTQQLRQTGNYDNFNNGVNTELWECD